MKEKCTEDRMNWKRGERKAELMAGVRGGGAKKTDREESEKNVRSFSGISEFPLCPQKKKVGTAPP